MDHLHVVIGASKQTLGLEKFAFLAELHNPLVELGLDAG